MDFDSNLCKETIRGKPKKCSLYSYRYILPALEKDEEVENLEKRDKEIILNKGGRSLECCTGGTHYLPWVNRRENSKSKRKKEKDRMREGENF